VGCLCFVGISLAHAVPGLQLNSSTDVSNAGYYQLTWSWPTAPSDTHYSLLESTAAHSNGQWHQVYAGPDLASVISGKRNGTYLYMVRAISESGKILAHSLPMKVVVSHHSLVRAWIVFAIGAFIFLATLYVILRESAKLR